MNAQQSIAFYNNIIIVKEVRRGSILKLIETFFQNEVFNVFSSIADTFLITALQHSRCKTNMDVEYPGSTINSFHFEAK